MDLRELLAQILESQADHPRRLLASSVGVFGGAAALVLLLAAGSGFQTFMTAELAGFGRGVVFLHPTTTSSGFEGVRKGVPVRFARADARHAERGLPEQVEALLPEHMAEDRMLVEGAGRAKRMDLSGADERFAAYRNFTMEHGRFFDAADVARRSPLVVLGADAAVALFGSAAAAAGRGVRIEGQRFEVVGVARRKGRQYFNVGRSDNELVIVPITTAETRLGFDDERVTRLLLYPRRGVPAEAAIRAVDAVLGPRVGYHPDDTNAVKTFDTSEMMGLIDLLFAGWMVFVGLAGSVTLWIGGIGIANYQLAILAERSVEIAVAKAVGARNRVLFWQVALESTLVAGGVALLGVAAGTLACLAIGAIAPAHGLPAPALSPAVAGVTFAAVATVAVVASLLPALRVRRMEVGAALRCAL